LHAEYHQNAGKFCDSGNPYNVLEYVKPNVAYDKLARDIWSMNSAGKLCFGVVSAGLDICD
jgi:hypothetical protein